MNVLVKEQFSKSYPGLRLDILESVDGGQISEFTDLYLRYERYQKHHLSEAKPPEWDSWLRAGGSGNMSDFIKDKESGKRMIGGATNFANVALPIVAGVAIALLAKRAIKFIKDKMWSRSNMVSDVLYQFWDPNKKYFEYIVQISSRNSPNKVLLKGQVIKGRVQFFTSNPMQLKAIGGFPKEFEKMAKEMFKGSKNNPGGYFGSKPNVPWTPTRPNRT